MNKEKLRAEMLKKREELSQEYVRAASSVICTKISKMDEFARAKTVLFYCSVKNEVNVMPLLEESMNDKVVCIPRMESEKGKMTARKTEDANCFIEGKFGILEPPSDSLIINPEEIDFVIVPLVAFDGENNRLGFGGGYYDRYLPKCLNAYKCAAAYSFQKVGLIDVNSFDIKIDAVITED